MYIFFRRYCCSAAAQLLILSPAIEAQAPVNEIIIAGLTHARSFAGDNISKGKQAINPIQYELQLSTSIDAKGYADERSPNKLAFCKQVRDETIASHPLLTDSTAKACDATWKPYMQKLV